MCEGIEMTYSILCPLCSGILLKCPLLDCGSVGEERHQRKQNHYADHEDVDGGEASSDYDMSKEPWVGLWCVGDYQRRRVRLGQRSHLDESVNEGK